MKKYFCIILTLLFSSCAFFSPEDDAISKERTFSRETDKAFESIERSQVKNHVEDLHQISLEKTNNENNTNDKNSAISIREVKLKGSASTLRELNQVLSYHCMKHRKRFSSEEVCNVKVNKSIERCENVHQKVTPDFVRCLKDELKRI